MSTFIARNLWRHKEYVFLSTIMMTFLMLNVIVNNATSEMSDLKIVTGSDLPASNAFKCVKSKEYLNNSFIICVKDPKNDRYVSAHFTDYAKYDEFMMSDFLNALNHFPGATVLDMGSNVGPYTLLASTAGYNVISIDPLPENQALLYNSIVLSQVDHLVTQVMNSVSDDHSSYFAYQVNPENPGNTQMVKDKDLTSSQDNARNVYEIKSVIFQELLDLVPRNNPVVVKIDIEGYECKALQNFLSSKDKTHFVPVIMMETVTICGTGRRSLCPDFKTRFLPALQKAGYKAFIPQPISYQEIISRSSCFFYILFVHDSVLPLAFLQHTQDRPVY